ncbi:spore maturation protein [Peptococcaceae bacterium SCADC1_2_3]|jgi:spore maturation protein B|nr:spore maturation protein [Peptococcaceae bacterium SCADC1_2_3]KFI35758.1 spore maturation protein [Peptococcaceae bacterium SCADC1_2_3]
MLYSIIAEISRWIIPLAILFILFAAVIKKVKVFEVFIEGAQEGFTTAIKTIPYLVAMLMAINIFRATGAMELLVHNLSPFFNYFYFPVEVLPHAIMRPLSGGAALGVATNIIAAHGPDSYLGRLVSTMQGSTDTTFYVLTLYFGSVGITRYRYAVISGLAADFTTLVASVFIVNKVFGTGG